MALAFLFLLVALIKMLSITNASASLALLESGLYALTLVVLINITLLLDVFARKDMLKYQEFVDLALLDL